MMQIEYVDRMSGKIETEKIYGHRALSLVYGDHFFARVFGKFLLPLVAKVPLFSRMYGALQRRRSSRKKIAPFVASYGVDVSEFAKKEFESFDDFFIRKLKAEARPVASDPHLAVMPADGRYLVFPDISKTDRFYVKGQSFSLSSFLQDEPSSRLFQNGAMAIIRLCPSDYHRFHFPVDGVPKEPRPIGGVLFSVNPIALKQNLSYLWQNKRVVTEIDAGLFGTVLSVEVGATFVGSIHQTFSVGQKVKKGEEKGYFSFGGSCIVLLFEKDRICFDEDLLSHSAKGLETRGLLGDSLGRFH